jgi:hypothetical protein
MTKGTRKIIFFSTIVLLVGGGLYYFLIHKKGLFGINVKGREAKFSVDGFVYTVGSKAQAYPKKLGEFGGLLVESYKDDKDFWLAKNTKNQEILLKKSDVNIV